MPRIAWSAGNGYALFPKNYHSRWSLWASFAWLVGQFKQVKQRFYNAFRYRSKPRSGGEVVNIFVFEIIWISENFWFFENFWIFENFWNFEIFEILKIFEFLKILELNKKLEFLQKNLISSQQNLVGGLQTRSMKEKANYQKLIIPTITTTRTTTRRRLTSSWPSCRRQKAPQKLIDWNPWSLTKASFDHAKRTNWISARSNF